MKENTLEVELCAFMLSIVMVKHISTVENLKEYFTAGQLASEANGMVTDDSSCSTVISAAVHQGLRLYKRGLLILGYSIDNVAAADNRGKVMEAFHDLRAFNIGWKIKFITPSKEFGSEDDKFSAIFSIRNSLLRLNMYNQSRYNDLRIIHYELNCRLSKDALLTPTVGVIRRKNVSDLGKRYFESIISNALDVVDAEYSSNSADSVTVLKTITDVVTKKMKKMNCVVSELFSEEETNTSDEEDESVIVAIENDSIDKEIAAEMLSFPLKSIIYTSVEKNNVIALFEKMKGISKNKGEKVKNHTIACRVKEFLSSRSGYSEIKIQSIKYWYLNSEKERQKRGRKVVQYFEAEVLGNLMICILEKKDTVRYFEYYTHRLSNSFYHIFTLLLFYTLFLSLISNSFLI